MDIRKKSIKNTKLKKCFVSTTLTLILVFGMAMSNVPTMVTAGTSVKVEAASKKKDKKKPVIKLSGKSKITATKGVSVKIPKVTAKDNKDGNVTKKIKVTVKKGKKSYSSIAKKIKNNKKVKFTATGKYTITYTVKDKAGNKATKKRYVTVKTKKKTTTEKTTETPNTEEATDTPTKNVTPTDYSKYNIIEVTFGGNTYKVVRDEKFSEIQTKASETSDKISLTIENDYDIFMVDKSDPRLVTAEYLSFLGRLKATDENGNDISDRIVVNETAFHDALIAQRFGAAIITIYVEDDKGNTIKQYFELNGYTFDDSYDENYFGTDYKLIDEDPKVYARLRKK